MPSFNSTKIFRYKDQQIFDLVSDVEKYPEFLPWCKKCQITNQISANHFEAVMVIKFKGVIEQYKSNVEMGSNDQGLFINVTAIEGPFKRLTNKWNFKEIDYNSCQVDFAIDFEFKSLILSKIIGQLFTKATEKMIKAFEDRAEDLYY